jgi:hypothetical protein
MPGKMLSMGRPIISPTISTAPAMVNASIIKPIAVCGITTSNPPKVSITLVKWRNHSLAPISPKSLTQCEAGTEENFLIRRYKRRLC